MLCGTCGGGILIWRQRNLSKQRLLRFLCIDIKRVCCKAFLLLLGGGRVVRWCWVNFQCRGVLLIWIRVGQEPIALAIGAGGGLFGHFFSRLSFLFSFFLSLGDGPI